MSLYNNMIYYYLTSKQKFVNFYNAILINATGFNEIRMLVNNKHQSIISRYLLFVFLTKFVNFFDYFKNKSIAFRSKFDIDADKIQLTKITHKGEKTIILDHLLVDNTKKISFEDISNQLTLIQPDDTMMSCIFLNFELINTEDNKICLKGFVIKYKDLDEKHHQTLKNILLFNNIEYCENSVINIKLIKNKKIMTFNLPLNEVSDKHINYFTNLDK